MGFLCELHEIADGELSGHGLAFNKKNQYILCTTAIQSMKEIITPSFTDEVNEDKLM